MCSLIDSGILHKADNDADLLIYKNLLLYVISPLLIPNSHLSLFLCFNITSSYAWGTL